MASELEIVYPGDATLYAILRRHEDAAVFATDADAFVIWSDADIADYDLPLADRDGDVYQGDWPTAVPAGHYRVLYYRQDDVEPALDDLLLATSDVYWNGHDIATASQIAVRADALTDLASVKRWLRIEHVGDDTLLAELINRVSQRIEQVCRRRFKLAVHRQWCDARDPYVLLQHHPLQQVRRVATGMGPALRIRYDGAEPWAIVSVGLDRMQLLIRDEVGDATVTDLRFAEHGSTSALAAAVAALDGWSAAAVVNVPTTWLHPAPGAAAKNREVTLTWPDADVTGAAVDSERGLLHWSGCLPAGRLLVEYQAGYDPIPEDLQLVATELVGQAYQLGRRDLSVQREQLGDYAYQLADSVQLSEALRGRLRPYMAI